MANPNPVKKFKKGDMAPVLAGQKSSRALSPELKALRAEKQTELEQTIYKYINMSLPELKNQYSDATKPAIDLLVIKCTIKAIEKGDFSWIEPMLSRSIGKTVDKMEVKAEVMSLHDQIMKKINE